MCLGIPCLVVEVKREEKTAVIEISGLRREVSIFLVEDVKVGDYLLVHAGYAIQKVDLEEAKRSLSFWEKVAFDGSPR